MGGRPAADAGSEVTVLVDTSAWVELFRATGSRVHQEMARRNSAEESFAICGPVEMEVLAGALTDSDLRNIRAAFSNGMTIGVQPHHFDQAAGLYRMCRAAGFTVRSMIDCLIATIAMDEDVEVLHHDRDFGAIAQVIPLRIHPASIN
ncbi:MAG: PIN domain nuclease [Actinomycetota bacterium]